MAIAEPEHRREYSLDEVSDDVARFLGKSQLVTIATLPEAPFGVVNYSSLRLDSLNEVWVREAVINVFPANSRSFPEFDEYGAELAQKRLNAMAASSFKGYQAFPQVDLEILEGEVASYPAGDIHVPSAVFSFPISSMPKRCGNALDDREFPLFGRVTVNFHGSKAEAERDLLSIKYAQVRSVYSISPTIARTSEQPVQTRIPLRRVV